MIRVLTHFLIGILPLRYLEHDLLEERFFPLKNAIFNIFFMILLLKKQYLMLRILRVYKIIIFD